MMTNVHVQSCKGHVMRLSIAPHGRERQQEREWETEQEREEGEQEKLSLEHYVQYSVVYLCLIIVGAFFVY